MSNGDGGNEGAVAERCDLTEVFVANRSRLKRVAQSIVNNAQGAEDVLQDAYLKLLGARTAMLIDQPLAYCSQIVRNMARDHLRRSAFESGLMALEDEGRHVATPHGQPELQAMRRQNIAILEDVLHAMPTRTRIAYEMYIIRGMTQRDISKALDVSLGLVNALISQAGDVLMQHRHLMAWE